MASLLSRKHYSLNFKKQFLIEIVLYLELDKSAATAYLPLSIADNVDNSITSDNPDYISIFLSDMESADSLTWCILRYLLLSKQGYDSRVRTLIMELFAIVYIEQAGSLTVTPKSPIANSQSSDALDVFNFDRLRLAYTLFTYLEHNLGTNLVLLKQSAGAQQDANDTNSKKNEKGKMTVKKMAKITSATVVAGTLFAVTGGLAAPGIAAGMAVLTTSSVAAASVAGVLTSTAAVTTIFGVGGGGLVGYKMKRRTAGLTEFHFEKRTEGMYCRCFHIL